MPIWFVSIEKKCWDCSSVFALRVNVKISKRNISQSFEEGWQYLQNWTTYLSISLVNGTVLQCHNFTYNTLHLGIHIYVTCMHSNLCLETKAPEIRFLFFLLFSYGIELENWKKEEERIGCFRSNVTPVALKLNLWMPLGMCTCLLTVKGNNVKYTSD